MAAPAIAAAIGALGVLSGIGGMQTGTSFSSHSLLSPIQQMLAMQLMGSNMGRLKGYFGTLGSLGQASQNPYSSLESSPSSFYGNVKLPMLQRQQSQIRDLTRDPSHERINKILNDTMRKQNELSINQLNADFTNQNRQMQIQGQEGGLSNQLGALSQMKGQFYSPLGVQMQENYYNPPVSPGSIISAGVTGLSALNQYLQNQKLESLLGQTGEV